MKNRDRLLLQQDESYPIGLGCNACYEKDVCGGVNSRILFSCRDLCCGNRNQCDFVCPQDLPEYIRQVNEIRNFDLNSILRAEPIKPPNLPLYVPLVYHNSAHRLFPIESDVVAISLMQLIDFHKRTCRISSYEHLCSKFGIKIGSKIVVTGVADDPPLEKYWYSRNAEFFKDLSSLGLAILTTPNYSTYLNAPRWTDLCNLKKTAICWEEQTLVGIPSSYHLNGRTTRDWQRLTEFIADRSEVLSVSFEFATIEKSRKDFCCDRLVELSELVPRRLQLIVRGGIDYLSRLSKHFDVVFIDTDPFLAACHRSKVREFGKPESVASEGRSPIDSILEHNIRVRRRIVHDRCKSLELAP